MSHFNRISKDYKYMLYIILSLITWFVSPGFDFTNDQAVTAWYQRRTSKPMDLVKVVQYDQKQASVYFY